MPRPTRIQYENAFYHVMNRGRGRQAIFHGESYYQAFLKTLEEATSRFDAVVHAYCLMGNHYHLLVETPRANLNRIMRHINGVFTQRYNRLRQTDGPLFRGRYKSILVDEDAYLLQLSRYIHRNPAEVKGATEETLNHYHWSSYLAYINKAKPESWLYRDKTYQMLGQRQKYAGYQTYVQQGLDEDILKFYSKGNITTILGAKEFRASIAEEKEELMITTDLSKALSNRPSGDQIVSAVANVYRVATVAVRQRQGGRQFKNEAKKMAMYCCQQYGDMPLKEIAAYFGLTHSGSVSPAISHIKQLISEKEVNKKLKRVKLILNIMK